MQFVTIAEKCNCVYDKLKLSINYAYRNYNTIILLQISNRILSLTNRKKYWNIIVTTCKINFLWKWLIHFIPALLISMSASPFLNKEIFRHKHHNFNKKTVRHLPLIHFMMRNIKWWLFISMTVHVVTRILQSKFTN